MRLVRRPEGTLNQLGDTEGAAGGFSMPQRRARSGRVSAASPVAAGCGRGLALTCREGRRFGAMSAAPRNHAESGNIREPGERWDASRTQRRIAFVSVKRGASLAVAVALVLLTAGTVSHEARAADRSGTRVVCGARFRALPSGWHQSGLPPALVVGGVVPSNTFSWAATPRSVFDLTRPLPRSGLYIWVDLIRPRKGPSGPRLRLPLRLRDARVIEEKGPVAGLPEYRFEGRYERQYDLIVGVDFGRTSPPPRLRARAERVLRRLVLPRWVPFRRRTCG